MKIAFTTIAATAALAMTLTSLPASAAAAQYNNDQQHRDTAQTRQPDYSKNKYYTLGNREGYEDYQKKTERPSHEHKYRNDTDRKAHDYGYQQGLHGQRGYPSTPDRR